VSQKRGVMLKTEETDQFQVLEAKVDSLIKFTATVKKNSKSRRGKSLISLVNLRL
jgi:hypothetical protein